MLFQEYLVNRLAENATLFMSKQKIGRCGKTEAIYINILDNNNKIRKISDVIKQLKMYFSFEIKNFYYKQGRFKNYIDINTELNISRTIYIE